jgi:tetratricopeptide (TPR) repeat protein
MTSHLASLFLNELVNIMENNSSAVSNIPLNYDDTMSGDKLNEIAQKYIIKGDYDNSRICLLMAIEKSHTKSMLQLGTYYEQVEPNVDEMIRLYTLTYENGDKEGTFALANYYTKIQNDEQMIKYLTIGANRFNDRDSIYNLIVYYQKKHDKINCLYWVDKLIVDNPNAGHYLKGWAFEKFNDTDCMKIHYTMFLEKLPPNPIVSHEDAEKILDIIKIYLHNEIDLPFIQTMLHKFSITDDIILGHLQFKINKTKLPNYTQTGECMICYETKDIQMYDCLGHHYCLGCTIKIEKCAVCKCTKKCIH